MPSLDLNLLPLVRRAGQDQAALPGLYAVSAPRRAARGRTPDRLIVYLHLGGNAPLPEEQTSQLLTRVAHIYFQTAGSVTSALRNAADALNQALLERNLRASGGGRQGIGQLILAVEREGQLYLGMCGPMHALVVTPQEVQACHDADSAGRGLGLSRTTPLRFYHAALPAGSYVLLTSQPPAPWTPCALQGTHSQGLESLRRRLLSQAGPELNAVLVQAIEGSGKMRLLWPKTPAVPPGTAVPEGSAPPVEGSTQVAPDATGAPLAPQEGASREAEAKGAAAEVPLSTESPAPGEPRAPGESAPSPVVAPPAAASPAASERPSPPAPSGVPEPSPTPEAAQGEHAARWLNEQPRPKRPALQQRLPRFDATPLKRALAAARHSVGKVLRLFFGSLATLLRRVLPDESLLTLPTSTMIFLAVAVPVVISAAGLTIFFQRGQSLQEQVYYEQAVAAAAKAQAATDPAEQRRAWQETLRLAELAQARKQTADNQALGKQAQEALDRLDSAVRLEFQNAIAGGLGTNVNVTALLANSDELYLLNSTQGNVQRAVITHIGYEMDSTFICGPGRYGGSVVGPLIDIAPLPKGSDFNATILGIDQLGNLVYCIPHDQPKSIPLATPTATGWGKVAGFALDLDTNNLYVFDSQTKRVWIYQKMAITTEPISYFDEAAGEVPPNFEDVIAFTVYHTDLYLLHQDGQLSVCTYGRQEGVLSRCESPMLYTDTRPGRQSGPVIADATFNAIRYTPPPDPSIYMLDAGGRSLYQFSLRMALYRLYHAGGQVKEGTATAFTVNERVAYLATGNQVYYAPLP